MSTKVIVDYREADAGDRAFVRSGWSSSFRTAHAAGMIAMSDWSRVMHEQIDKVLDRADCRTLVAYKPDEPDRLADLYGFLSYVPPVEGRPLLDPYVYYCYTAAPYRNLGIARGLFRAAGIDPGRPFRYACKTPATGNLKAKTPFARWRPLDARFAPDHRKDD